MIKLKSLGTLASLTLLLCASVLAHDEGHGPKLTDSGKYGGIVAPVVNMKEANKGAHATLVYKAELVRNSSRKVRIYLYDSNMKPLDISKLNAQVNGILGAKVKGKYKTIKFDLKREENYFIGQAPKAPSRPFNYDFHFIEGSRKLLSAFDHLD